MKALKVPFAIVMRSLVPLVLLLLSSGYYLPPYRETVIQFADPNPTETTCGHPDVQDAWIVEGVPVNSYGNCDNVPQATYKLYVGHLQGDDDGEYRTVIKFMDLSSIPANAVVEKAVLTMKQTWCQKAYPWSTVPAGCSGNTLGIEAHKVTSYWGEKTVRWMEMPEFDPVPLSTARVENVLGATLNLDITSVFREWLTGAPQNNHGVILIANPIPFNDFFRIRSHDTVCNEFGCSGGQGEPPGEDAPKITVTWRLS